MQGTIYIFSNGVLKRKDNTIYFEDSNNSKRFIPVERTKEIFIFGEVTINTKLLNFLTQKKVMLHFFNYYGYYSGTYYPREHYNSGYMIVNQAQHYTDMNKRLILAKKFVIGAIKNSLKILKYYQRRGKQVDEHISEIEIRLDFINGEKQFESINELMAVEGECKCYYYQAFNRILNNPAFYFKQRTRRPPQDYLNTLISFSNSLIYIYVLSEVYRTHLDPRIGFLHSSNFRSFSINLDVAEIFKPIIGDRLIISLINKKIIAEKDFEKDFYGLILKEAAKKKFLKHMEERLNQTIKHSTLKKKVSYRRLMRLELYKIEKHLMGEKEYSPFVMDW